MKTSKFLLSVCCAREQRSVSLSGFRWRVEAGRVTDLIFVDPEAKVNGAYYRDVLLSQQLLPMMCDMSGEFFIFQQDSAPVYQARDTVRLLELATPTSIPPDRWPQNSPDLNPVVYKMWTGASSSSECITHRCTI